MGKHWARQQVRQDEVQDAVGKSLLWVEKNRQQAMTAAGVVAVVLLVGAVGMMQMASRRAAAWDRLALAQSFAYSGGAQPALAQLEMLAKEQPNSDAAGFGAVFSGDILFQKGQYKEAMEQYNKVLERGSPKTMLPVALANLAVVQESAGQFKESIATAQRYLETYPDHYLAAQVHTGMARSLRALGQIDQAKAAFQKIALQYPDTSWATWAQAQLK